MKSRRIAWLLLVLVLLFVASAVVWLASSYRLVPRVRQSQTHKQERSTADFKPSNGPAPQAVWRLAIRLDGTGLDIPALQYALFSEDPKELLKQRMQRRPGPAPILWDLLFTQVTGDDVGLLISNPNSMVGMMSNGPGGKKWLVTKVSTQGGKAYCWSIPFETDAEGEAIVLNKDNVMDLNNFVPE